ncbi:MAG: exodeoxyribonuclease VII large subunit [Chlamydiae bacterium]|nr:exodeoxyribonuclease VII large subunit [Chlamydiota bacterium]MBI3276148.1 exodeoxyribonuclease VII large subunit [Chlamydiota bacterium]
MPVAEKIHIYSVSELTRELKGRIEEHYPSLWVEGEVSNVKMPSSGHLYFTLKDAGSQIQAVFFAFRNKSLPFTLKDGMKVIVSGFLTVYEKGGNYQINIKKMEPAGIGALQLAFEQLKKKLFEEGLFDPAHKRMIPQVPSKIGIVTSPTGAALKDILNVLDRRFSNMHIILAPTPVQGDDAPPQIVKAIELLNEMNEVEVIIVTRGGGSLEDLWAFNDEKVARAIYASKIPVISAVGHEIDWTIGDFVADLRVPTPTAAAELVTAKKSDLLERLTQLEGRIVLLFSMKIQSLRQTLQHYKEHPVFKYPKAKLEQMIQNLDSWRERYFRGLQGILDKKKSSLDMLTRHLEALSPLSVLARGFSITRLYQTGEIIKDIAQLKRGETLETLLSKGKIVSTVKSLTLE